jgi:hypothetical protein
MMSKLSRKALQFKNQHLGMAYTLKSQFLLLSQSRLSTLTVQKASLDTSRKYRQFEKGHLNMSGHLNLNLDLFDCPDSQS